MLRSISISHWRSHAHTRIQLGPGANLLIGPMGAGKSSVMDALCFALYGTYPKLGRRDVKLEEVSNFRHPGQSVSVEVEWDDSEGASGERAARHTYKVRRELDAAQAWLYADGKLLQKGPRAVTEEIERLLGIPYELFSRAVYAEQNRLDAWLALAPAARKAELDRLLGLDRFERVRAGASAELGRLKEKAQAAEAAAPPERLAAEQKSLEALNTQLAARAAELEEKKNQSARSKAELEGLTSQWAAMEKIRQTREELSARIQKCAGSISTYQSLLSSAPPAPAPNEMEKQAAELSASRTALDSELKSVQSEQDALAQASGRLAELIKAEEARAARLQSFSKQESELLVGQTPDALEAALQAAKPKLEACLAQLASMQNEDRQLEQVLKTLSLAGPAPPAGATAAPSARCPVCHQPLDEAHRQELEGQHRARREELARSIAENRRQEADARKEITRLSDIQSKAARLSAQRAALGGPADLARLSKEQDASRAKLQALSERRAKLSERQRALAQEESKLFSIREQAARVQKWQADLAAAQRESGVFSQKLQALTFDDSAYAALKVLREQCLAAGARLAESVQSLGKMAAQDRQLLEAQSRLLEQLRARRAEADAARKEMDELSAFRTVLLSAQSSLRARLLSDINAALARIWPLVYPYGDWGQVRLVAGEKDYAVEIRQNEWKALEAHASGGERACLGLALRVALSVLLTPQLGWLILDEPTHNLDSRAVQALGRALAERIPQVVPQVIVITHETQLVESTPGRVIRFERDKLKGEDTRAEAEGAG